MVDLNNPQPESPLDGLESPGHGIDLSEARFVGKVNIRGNADDAAFVKVAGEVIGTHLPLDPNTVSGGDANGANTIYWLGPDEWLVHTPTSGEDTLVPALTRAFAGLHTAVTNVSDYYVVFDLAGPKAREALMRGTPLDVHESVFAAGQCAQTRYAHASVLLHCTSNAPSYRVQVRWTYAAYLWNYMAAVARQWGPRDLHQ